MDGIVAGRGGTVRYPNHGCQPGFFRTELLTENSTNYAKTSIEDYKEHNAQQHEFWKAQNGKQSGDPAKLAQALITLTNQKELPRRFIAGADAIGTVEQKVALEVVSEKAS